MNKVFFSDRVLKFVMYNKRIPKQQKMLAFAVLDFIFQMSLIGLVLFVLMLLLNEMSRMNLIYVVGISVIAGIMSVVLDVQKVKLGKIQLEKPEETDARDPWVGLAMIGAYLISIICGFIFIH